MAHSLPATRAKAHVRPPHQECRRTAKNGPDPIDLHVGRRIRLRRILLGISQGVLGYAVGLTFQQIQKYERGTNRVSASMLYRLAQALDVPVSFFFDDLSEGLSIQAPHPHENIFIQAESLRLLRNYYASPQEIRKQIHQLLKAVGRKKSDDDR